MEKNTITGERKWIGNPKVSVSVHVQAYGIGTGKGYLEDITILGNHYREDQAEEVDVGGWWEDKGTGWYDKGTGETGVYGTTTEDFDEIPIIEVKDSYYWSAEGYIILTAKKWKTTVNENISYALPLQVKATFGKSGEWVDAGTRKRWAKSGTYGYHEITYVPYNPLSVSFNKTTFTSDEELVVSVSMDRLTSTDLRFGNQISSFMGKKDKSTDSPYSMTITADFSDLDFSSSNEWYGKVTVNVHYTTVDGTSKSEEVEQYITVKKVGLFENSTLFNDYGTYEAEVFAGKPIKEVHWSIKKPGGEWERDKLDNVNGGSNSSSWSYSLDSKSPSGWYKVEVLVVVDGKTITIKDNYIKYYSSFYVY